MIIFQILLLVLSTYTKIEEAVRNTRVQKTLLNCNIIANVDPYDRKSAFPNSRTEVPSVIQASHLILLYDESV